MVTQKKDYVYTQNFCEENIWQLGRQLQAEGEDVADFEVLMLSNEVRQIPLLSHQPSSEPIVWDYHVILRQKSKPLMFDFDSVLPFPCSTADYHEQTFMADDQVGSRWVVWARCIPLNRYLPAFYSNRAHMIDAEGQELSPFPEYPPILGEPAMRLEDILDFSVSISCTNIVRLGRYCV